MTTSLTWQVTVHAVTGARGRKAHAFVSTDGQLAAAPLCNWGDRPRRTGELAPATPEEITTQRCCGCDDELREGRAA